MTYLLSLQKISGSYRIIDTYKTNDINLNRVHNRIKLIVCVFEFLCMVNAKDIEVSKRTNWYNSVSSFTDNIKNYWILYLDI